MHSARFSLLLFLLLSSVPIGAQQPQAAPSPPQPPSAQQTQLPTQATKDPQAVSIVNQALSASGGASAIDAITDYTATGTATYHFAQDVQGTVTLRGLGLGEFRMDSNLTTGVRSEVDTDHSQLKDEHGLTKSYPVPMNASRVAIPVMPLIPALSSPSLNVTYKGLVQLADRSVHQIEVSRFLPIALSDPNGHFHDFHTIDFFIDASTFQVLMIQDVVAKKSVRQIWYSDYRSFGGVLVPFSINEKVEGQPTWQLMLGQINFNSGLQDSDFQP